MATSAQLRLMSDLKSIINEPPEGCSASPVSDANLFVWSATIFGPDESPWEGGAFGLRLTFGENYPGKPPRVRFTSEMFHPNVIVHDLESRRKNQFHSSGFASLGMAMSFYLLAVYHDGSLCLDIIQDAWSPCHNVSTILTSVQSLLTDPNPASPANPEAAHMYQHDIQAYNKKVRRCARRSIDD